MYSPLRLVQTSIGQQEDIQAKRQYYLTLMRLQMLRWKENYRMFPIFFRGNLLILKDIKKHRSQLLCAMKSDIRLCLKKTMRSKSALVKALRQTSLRN